MSGTPRVAILMGSDSDLPTMKSASDTLSDFGVDHEVKVLSAHRSPARAVAYVESAPERGIQAFICAAGMAAHLAGVVAAHTSLPVIGVPMKSSAGLAGADALYSTVMMPPGIPVRHRWHRRGEERGAARDPHPGPRRCGAFRAGRRVSREHGRGRGAEEREAGCAGG